MEENIKCSFCAKDRNQVDHMIEGPEQDNRLLYICNECVDFSFNVLHEVDNKVIPL